ncbi:MAG: sugar transferase [Acetatifactor sp.]|nr:sugar transferase [Acetatifactor sp.]
MYQKKSRIEKYLVLLIDIICVVFSLTISLRIRFDRWMWQSGEDQWILYFVLLAYLVVGLIFDFYRHFYRRGYWEEFRRVLESELATILVILTLLYIIHRTELFSRLVFGYFIVINTTVMYAFRLIFKQVMTKLYRTSRYSNRLLLITNSRQAAAMVYNISLYNEWYRQLIGIALTDDSGETEIAGIPVVANTDNLQEFVVRGDIDEVFIADGALLGTETLNNWITEFGQMGIVINVNISEFDLEFAGKKTLNRVGKYATVTFSRNIFSNRQLLLKRTMDIVGSLVGMVILGIATVFVAPAIKLDSPGPVFFGQTRVGKNGRKFTFYKFRSMYVDAEERKKELMNQNEVQGLMFKMEDDPRITRVGKFIRRTSIDELPQFWNILRGDMSLVGTRPPTVDEFEHYEMQHKGRLSMTPGLTGLWQVSGRSSITDFDEVVKLDMEYIDDWNIGKDIKILLMTVKIVLTGKGAK